MQNSINTTTTPEPNFWLRQAAELERLEIEADAQFLCGGSRRLVRRRRRSVVRRSNRRRRLEKRAAAKVDHDYGWAAFLIIWWFAWVAGCYYKTAPGGIAAVPMFLILLAIGTTVGITAWIKTR